MCVCGLRDLGSIDSKTTHPISKLKSHFKLTFSLRFVLKNKNLIRSILRVTFKGHLFPFQTFIVISFLVFRISFHVSPFFAI